MVLGAHLRKIHPQLCQAWGGQGCPAQRGAWGCQPVCFMEEPATQHGVPPGTVGTGSPSSIPKPPRACPRLGPAHCNELLCSQLREPCPQRHRQAQTCEGCVKHCGGCGGASLAPSRTPSLGAGGGGGSVQSPNCWGSLGQGCWLSSASPSRALPWERSCSGAILSPVGASPLSCRDGMLTWDWWPLVPGAHLCGQANQICGVLSICQQPVLSLGGACAGSDHQGY